ncbi:MAG: HEAT repeat domain-containing protein [Armatimonadetes bacterium]|nr:HEAT repeat domain-containing protein [Armatimonadota bacterium]
MSDPSCFLWSFEDYRSLLERPESRIRQWAWFRIHEQYPERKKECLPLLLADPEPALRRAGVRLAGEQQESQYIPLLERMFREREPGLAWDAARALAELRSEETLEQLIGLMDDPLRVISAVRVLERFPDARAQGALWSYYHETGDRRAFRALARRPGPGTCERLLGRQPQAWQVVELVRGVHPRLVPMAREAARAMGDGPGSALAALGAWLGTPVHAPEGCDRAPDPIRFLRESLPLEGDWSSSGREWRIFYSCHLLEALCGYPPLRLAAQGVALALVVHLAMDPGGLGPLQALSCPSPISEGSVRRVAALGPETVSRLAALVRSSARFPRLRALQGLALLARSHPGCADIALEASLELLDNPFLESSASEAVVNFLIAAGPGAVEPIASRLGEDCRRDVPLRRILSRIPTRRSVEILVGQIHEESGQDETLLEALLALGDPGAAEAVMPFCKNGIGLVGEILETVRCLRTGRSSMDWGRREERELRGRNAAG